MVQRHPFGWQTSKEKITEDRNSSSRLHLSGNLQQHRSISKVDRGSDCRRAKRGFTDSDNKWQVVQPLAGLPTPIRIQPETIAVLFEVKEYDLAHDLGQLSRQHNSVREVVQTYATLRTELRSLLKVAPPAKDDIPGKLASFLSPEEAASLRPRFVELESIINGLRKLLPAYNDAGKKVLAEFKPAAIRQFKNQDFPGIEFK